VKLHLLALVLYLWGALVMWFGLGCSSAVVEPKPIPLDPYQTCLVASLLSPRTPELAAKAGLTAEQWSESFCRLAAGAVQTAEAIASACAVPDRPAGIAGAPSWP
jgi:hypothetical protein